MSSTACASPCASASPAVERLSQNDIAVFADKVLSQAKARTTPGKSPPAPLLTLEPDYEKIVPRSLFTECDKSLEAQKEYSTFSKTQSCPHNLVEIPSPSRSRAKKQAEAPQSASAAPVAWSMWEEPAPQEDASCQENGTFYDSADEDKATRVTVHATKDQESLEEWLQEQAEMAAMDEHCVECFLEAVSKVSWRDRVRTPIKGTNLYTKFMRPCRREGTSVDVKDSSFKTLGNFLRFLESEGLLYLQPGLTDPVVGQIDLRACKKYCYRPPAF
jgi:hypothetical protein